ncbi:MAG: hypothetical protein M1813_008922 [Trichoglossum hirsutum]|nr:MAG: hypothetical protein M1813_008922 [Trichoglossum hirsutum]
MLTATWVNLRYWFYPIGNTPAVNLLRDGAFDSQGDERLTVTVLLLACGDPRSILFTLWCGNGFDDRIAFDFTCCDLDPAVLARNVILFALIMDRDQGDRSPSTSAERDEAIWNIFYHLYISEGDLKLLQDNASRLVQVSDCVDMWLASPYGRLIEFMSQDTLKQLRTYWSLYAETKNFTNAQKKAFEYRAREGISKIYRERIGGSNSFHGFRSAGAHRMGAMETMAKAFKGFWDNGVVGGTSDGVLRLGRGGKGWVNPMFAISSAPTGNVAVHYGSDPLLGFHLAEAFDSSKPSVKVEQVVYLAKSQFRDWCNSFVMFAKTGGVRIKFFCGDAIRFGHELQSNYYNRSSDFTRFTRLYLGPWTSRPLVLDWLAEPSQKPHLFDVIDTSNLADHVGILNVLPAVAPMLSRKPSSVLYTENLIASEGSTSTLQHLLCSDVTTMALVIGLAPVGLLLGFTTDAVGNESLLSSLMNLSGNDWHLGQDRMRIPWKVPELGDIYVASALENMGDMKYQLSLDAEQLANYFFDLYLQMFAQENITGRLPTRQPALRMAKIQHYTRLSMVVLLQLAKANILTNWERVVRCFLDKVEADRYLLVGMNCIQELYLYLRLFGLWQNKALDETPRESIETTIGPLRPPSGEKGPLSQIRFPPVVFVSLIVPREELRVFTDQALNSIGTPGLHLYVEHSELGFENSFFAIQCFFCRTRSTTKGGTAYDIDTDSCGWIGSADLLVTCPVPTFMLLLGSKVGIRVGLAVNTSPFTFQYTLKLGLKMTIFECGLEDEDRLWVTEEAPGVSGVHHLRRFSQLGLTPSLELNPSIPYVLLSDKGSPVTQIQIRVQLPQDSEGARALMNGAEVTAASSSACTIRLDIGGTFVHRLVYPFPIGRVVSKIKVARESSWVEVIASIAPAHSLGGYRANPFPLVQDVHQKVTWGLSRVRLDQQPIVPVGGDFNWLRGFMGLTLSASERVGNILYGNSLLTSGSPDFFNLGVTIEIFFGNFVGKYSQCTPIKIFHLASKSRNGSIDTLILATAIRHDLDAGSILLDAYAVPLTRSRCTSLRRALESLHRSRSLIMPLLDEESILWKQLLPSLAERCRYTWTHRTSCEYRVQGRVPLSTVHAELPLCSCGEGQALEGFPNGNELKPFRKYATRIAIPPLFAVPYAEPLMTEEVGRSMGRASGSTSAGCDYCGVSKPDLKITIEKELKKLTTPEATVIM